MGRWGWGWGWPGGWACVFTLNAIREGQGSQRVVSTVSTDEGRSWTPLVDVEPYVAPTGQTPRSTGWVNPLLVPATGRIFAFCTSVAALLRHHCQVAALLHHYCQSLVPV